MITSIWTSPMDDNLPAVHQGRFGDPGEVDPRIELYNLYAVPSESYESFCDRMADDLGSNWVYKLTRK